MKLNNTICKNAKPQAKAYKKFDGGGLYLEIMPNGNKLWRLKYYHLGKEKRISLGAYPLVSLANARDARDNAKKLLMQDIDPSVARKDKRQLTVRNAANTFEAIAREWHENQTERWSQGYPNKVMRYLEKDIFPHIGNRPIAQITPLELLECLRKIEKRKALDTTTKTKQICGQIFRYGIQTGKCESNPAADLKGALRTKKTEHFAAIDAKDLPEFLKAIELNKPRLYARTVRALKLSLLTFQRPGEIRQAQWSEINLEEAVWSIAAEKMKMRRPHMVPLSKQAIEILKEQKEETGYMNTDWVFPSMHKPKKCMSDGTVNKAIQRLGYGESMTAHGFRALARTTIREKLGYDSEVIEKQLAHETKNPLRRAYDRTEFLEERRKMMQHWSDYLDTVAIGGKVIPTNFRKQM